jgi:CDP-diacylglycerol--glycerol-3-phosphate 3-phosphatidyltransferase
MTTANKITILRIFLVPFFIVQLLVYVESGDEWHRLLAVLSFAAAAFGDALDGYVARRYNQHSELGAILDPLADKLLLVSGVVILSLPHQPYFDRLPLWLVATIISRDMLLLMGMVVIHYACGKVIVRPHFIGKMATVLQMNSVLWVLLKWNKDWLQVWTIGAAVCTGVSGVFYVLYGVRQLSTSPSSAASPKQSGADVPAPDKKTK